MDSISQLVGYTRGLKKLFVFIGLASVTGALVNLLTPLIMKFATDWVVDVASNNAQFEIMPLVWLVVAFIAAMLVTTAVSDIGGYFGDQLAIRTRKQLSSAYFKHLLALPQKYYDTEITGKIINRLSRAIADVTQFLQFFSNNLLQMLLTIVVTIVILMFYSWPLAALFVLLIPSNLYLTALTSGRWQKHEADKNRHFDFASGRFAEVIGQMRLVKSFGTEKRELSKFDSEVGAMIGITASQSLWWHSMNALRSVVFGLIFAAIYGVLFYQTARGDFSVGDMVLLLTLIQQVAFPMRNLSFFVDSYQRAVANSKDFLEAMSEEPESADNRSSLKLSPKAHVTFEDVKFSYQAKTQVLKDISFEIKPGTKLALVGESGGGKTTLANLLMRLYEVDDGKICINGTDISRVSRASVRQMISTVFQDASLFSGTIRENIAYAQPEANDEDVEKAARAANAWGFIQEFDDGIETEIGERGVRLSGGQKQRIAIARALLKNSPILILDEATSALDSRAESEVQQALDRLMKNRTTLIIAHRLSTIAQVDTIVTLKKGNIDEVGSPSDLAKTGGIYSQLLELQLGASERAKKQLARYDIAS